MLVGRNERLKEHGVSLTIKMETEIRGIIQNLTDLNEDGETKMTW